MAVIRLALTNFRSYADALIEAGPDVVVLSGENGAGKTNVLEALSLLAPGRGLRQATLSEMARSNGPGGFAVAGRLFLLPLPPAGGDRGVGASAASLSESVLNASPSREREGSEIDIGTGTLPTAPERRQVRINGASSSAAALAEWLSVLWLTPAMDRLFIEGASGRRRFLDRLVLALRPDHGQNAARYEAAMRARNRLLAEPDTADPAWLSALEAGMAEHGAAMAEARSDAVEALGARLAIEPDQPFARAALSLAGWLPGAGADALAYDLKAGRGRDAAAGRTLAGPHRTDLLVTHAAKRQPADRCSTGEQKALLLGIVLAHTSLVAERTGRTPLLLLDEVAAHLDPVRRGALFERLSHRGAQTWLTGTERSLFDGLGSGTTWIDVRPGDPVLR